MKKRKNIAPEEPLSDELVAYLDGELSESASRRVEQQLSEDNELRERLHQHQETWDMLDQLPKTRGGDQFAQTTLEMVTLSATGNFEQKTLFCRSRLKLVWIGAGLSTAAASLIGYFTVTAIVTAPNRQLVQDLPVIENLDAYRHAESVDFLEAMSEKGLFTLEDDGDAL